MTAEDIQGILYVPNIILLICTVAYGLLLSFSFVQPSLFGNLVVAFAIALTIIRLALICYADKYERMRFADYDKTGVVKENAS